MIFESRIFEVYFSTGERISHKSTKRFLLESFQSGMSLIDVMAAFGMALFEKFSNVYEEC